MNTPIKRRALLGSILAGLTGFWWRRPGRVAEVEKFAMPIERVAGPPCLVIPIDNPGMKLEAGQCFVALWDPKKAAYRVLGFAPETPVIVHTHFRVNEKFLTEFEMVVRVVQPLEDLQA